MISKTTENKKPIINAGELWEKRINLTLETQEIWEKAEAEAKLKYMIS